MQGIVKKGEVSATKTDLFTHPEVFSLSFCFSFKLWKDQNVVTPNFWVKPTSVTSSVEISKSQGFLTLQTSMGQ